MRRAKLALSALALALALAAPLPALASPQDLYGFGARSVAMGATGASFLDDYSAVHANPAGLSRARLRSLTIGYQGGAFALWIDRGGRGNEHHSVDAARGILLGLTVPIPLPGILKDRIGFGVGLHLPIDVLSRNRVLRPETPQFLLLESRAQAIALQGGLGIELPYGFRVGVGAAALAALSGNLVIANDANGQLNWRIDDRLVTTYAAIAGLSWERAIFRVGLSFRDQLVGDLDVRIEARDLGITLPPFNLAGVSQFDPRQFDAEVGFAPPGWILAFGATVKLWSAYQNPIARTTPRSPIPLTTGFSDTVVFRGGAERTIALGRHDLVLRGGYFYEPSPAPQATGFGNYLDNDRHAITFGSGVRARWRGTTISAESFGQVHVVVPQTVTKDPSVPADNAGAPTIGHGGAMYFFGVAATVSL